MPNATEEPVVLASASPRRRELLARAGVRFEVVPSSVEERPLAGEGPRALALRLAREKALDVARRFPASPRRLVLGADTVVVLEDSAFGKPADGEETLKMLRRLAGRAHRVLTAVALVETDRLEPRSVCVESTVVMRPATEAELRAYVATGEPLDKAGAYAAQGEGRRLVERIEGSETNVIGLPMEETLALLRAAQAKREAPPREAKGATQTGFAERLRSVRARVASAAHRVGRDPGKITLIGVTKRVDASRVAEAVSLGLTDLGENYVQEARGKIAAVREILRTSKLPQAPRWHGIGQLQRNKAREAVLLFDAIHSVDRIELARELDRRAGQAGRRLEVFLQVNLSGEPQKGGVPPSSLGELAAECAGLAHLSPIGLMTVPAENQDPQAARPAFAALRELARGLREKVGGDRFVALSMGMSQDFEVAIEEGATHIRVGTALFGPRES